MSSLTERRGLKSLNPHWMLNTLMSSLTERRGLKFETLYTLKVQEQSSLTERRGLKYPPAANHHLIARRLSQRDVDWNCKIGVGKFWIWCRLSQRDVDWNYFLYVSCPTYGGRLSQRDVDWNLPEILRTTIILVVSHRETWIEITSRRKSSGQSLVVSHRETWIEIR